MTYFLVLPEIFPPIELVSGLSPPMGECFLPLLYLALLLIMRLRTCLISRLFGGVRVILLFQVNYPLLVLISTSFDFSMKAKKASASLSSLLIPPLFSAKVAIILKSPAKIQ
jgi:hypothetical protein